MIKKFISDDYAKIFKKIIDASQNNSLVFFVGAGVSKLSGAPLWRNLINYFLEKGNIKNVNTNDYLKIAQIFYQIIGDEKEYHKHISDFLNKKILIPNDIHKLLFSFKPRAFVTTNYDDLLEKAAVENCQTFKLVTRDKEISSINGDKFILKVHGDLKHENIVLKKEDYLNYSENFKLTETLLKSIFATNTVVFIGYGLGDYNIELILNWTKNLLKDNFNNPIFIYTGDIELEEMEIGYQKSRGLNVIDYHKCGGRNKDYENDKFIERYRCVLEDMKSYSEFSLENKNDIEKFNVLHKLLKPLDKFNSLRVGDVRKKLPFEKYDIHIDDVGRIIFINDGIPDLMKYFYEINSMTYEEQEGLPKEIFSKYKTIVSVLSKANIRYIDLYNEHIQIKNVVNYDIDELCIQFDYKGMNDYVNNSYQDLYELYKKAYYLVQLKQYERAYNLFVDVATNSFKEKNYVLYYLAQINRKILYKLMEHINSRLLNFNNKYNLKNLDGGELSDNELETVFENLPVKIQNNYKNFKNLISLDILFKNSYDFFKDGEKLRYSIENNTYEFGITSLDKVYVGIYNNLYFFINNGICMELYTEFKVPIKNLIGIRFKKYIMQKQERLELTHLDSISKNKEFSLDEIDFYCFIKCFESKEIVSLFEKNKIESIKFNNIDKSVLNLIEYYDYLKSSNNFAKIHEEYEYEIKNCLVLLRYMDIKQNMVDRIIEFIFKYEFKNINIDEKVLFINSQICKKKMYSKKICEIIKEKFKFYIDKHRQAIENGRRFSTNYFSLIHYISNNRNEINVDDISEDIFYIIINSEEKYSISSIYNYFGYLSQDYKGKIIDWLKEKLELEFDFDKFYFLILNGVSINDNINQFKDFLYNEIKKIKEGTYCSESEYLFAYIGTLFLNGYLNRQDFNKFVGIGCLEFDFYFQYEDFDFEKFDISWLFKLNENDLENLFKNFKVKEKIKDIVIEKIRAGNLIDSYRQRLIDDILIKYLI